MNGTVSSNGIPLERERERKREKEREQKKAVFKSMSTNLWDPGLGFHSLLHLVSQSWEDWKGQRHSDIPQHFPGNRWSFGPPVWE